MSKRVAALAAAAALSAAAGLAAPSSVASSKLLVGFFDEAHTLYGNPGYSFPLLRKLHTQVLRVNLHWGGRFGVANRKPFDPSDPADPAYDWSLYDRTVRYAAANHIKILFSIYGTPGWENKHRGVNHAPLVKHDLAEFAYAAAIRYAGDYPGYDGVTLPPVRYWLAWNEPNNPVFLSPQYRRVGSKWVAQSAIDYANICEAVWSGVHITRLAKEKVACGGTAPRGNNNPRSSRQSISPVPFARALKKAGLKQFDAYAHHPYYSSPSESPTTKPVGARGGRSNAITLANINVLIKTVNKLFGPHRFWITEYGYQTDPPDPVFGVPLARQAGYLTEAFRIARRNPHIDMMLWYLLQDEPRLSGWQSGLITASGQKKPAFAAFRLMARSK